MRLAARPGRWFVSTGDAWGTVQLKRRGAAMEVCLEVLGGQMALRDIDLRDWGQARLPRARVLKTGAKLTVRVARTG